MTTIEPRECDFDPARWRQDADGALVVETAGFVLRVSGGDGSGQARYLVVKRQAGGGDQLMGSGTTADIEAAMRAAWNMAERLDASASGSRRLVMVVDDDDDVRKATADALRDGGYDAVEAASGETVLRWLERADRPAVLVVDLNLGEGMSGLALADTVRQRWPSVGIVLMGGDWPSAHGDAPDDFLVKPFSTARMLERVAEVAARMQPPTAQAAQAIPPVPGRPGAPVSAAGGLQGFLQRENIRIFTARLHEDLSPEQRYTVQRLLLEEERRYGLRSEHLDIANWHIADGERRIERQRQLVRRTIDEGRRNPQAERLLDNLIDTQMLFRVFRASVMKALDRSEL